MDRFYGEFVQPGDLVFDIGAHVGDRSLACRAAAERQFRRYLRPSAGAALIAAPSLRSLSQPSSCFAELPQGAALKENTHEAPLRTRQAPDAAAR
jgi:hypothetical protein